MTTAGTDRVTREKRVHEDGEKASCERGEADGSRGRNAKFKVQGDTSGVDNGTDECGRRTHALR